MLSKKNQKYIFERLLRADSVMYEVLEDGRFVFTDGVRLFVFSKEQIKFDISKCAPSDKLKPILNGALDGMQYAFSEEIRVNDNKNKTYRKLVSPTDSIWIEEKFAKEYRDCTLIGNGSRMPLCAIDDYGDFIAAIMPCDMSRGPHQESEGRI